MRLPLAQPIKRSKGLLTTSDNLVVRVEADGVVGWGEAGSAPTLTGDLPEGMLAAARYLAPLVEGHPLDDIAGAMQRMDSQLYGNGGAKSAIEMALFDALGRALGKPVYELLGGKRRDAVPALRYIASGDTAKDVAEAKQLREGGYTAFKIKLSGDVRKEIERTRAICEVLGKGVLISADVNQGWSAAEAVEYVRTVEHLPLAFLEQPVRGPDLAGMAAVAAASRIPVGCDEGLHGLEDLRRHHAARAAAGASLKAMKLGGLNAVLAAARLSEELGMKVNLSCKIAESGIATAAVLHLAAALPSLDWGVSLTSQYLAGDLVRTPIEYVGGNARVPEGPGLGITVDESLVRRYAN